MYLTSAFTPEEALISMKYVEFGSVELSFSL